MPSNPKYAKEYREKNKAKIKAYNQKWYRENPEYVKRQTKKLRDKMESDIEFANNIRKMRAESERKYRSKPENQTKIIEYNQAKNKKIANLKANVKSFYGCLNPRCQWVGELPAYCLDFHHINEKIKKFSIGKGAYSLNSIVKEMEKCTVLCAICHRQQKWGKLDVTNCKKCEPALIPQINKLTG